MKGKRMAGRAMRRAVAAVALLGALAAGTPPARADEVGRKGAEIAGKFGDAVIHELLEERGKLPALPRRLDAVVYPFGEAERPAAVRLAQALRARGEAVELVLGSVKPKRALADAEKAGAVRIYLVGPDERARGVAKVRELASGVEHDEPLPAASA